MFYRIREDILVFDPDLQGRVSNYRFVHNKYLLDILVIKVFVYINVTYKIHKMISILLFIFFCFSCFSYFDVSVAFQNRFITWIFKYIFQFRLGRLHQVLISCIFTEVRAWKDLSRVYA